jgi:hypothetical protein
MPFAMTAHAAGWDSSNNPYAMSSSFIANFEALPVEGQMKDTRKGWPGSHWANYTGGIASRWSAGTPENFKYKFLSLEELKKLEPHQLAELSPAEKYDIYRGDYTYSTVRRVYKSVSPYDNEWFGICHGYAPAALNHPEPATVDLINPDGIKVHFYSSDVAGLMSYFYAKVANTPATLVGTRCRAYEGNVSRRRQDDCSDINPGSFHIILANKLGSDGSGFIADMDRYLEVWNHVAVRYKTYTYAEEPATPSSAYGTVRRVRLETLVTYAAAIAPKFYPVLNTEAAEYVQNTYEYYLDLSKTGEIIGGEWISSTRPDFVWTQKQAEFTGYWDSLNDIYRPATINP